MAGKRAVQSQVHSAFNLSSKTANKLAHVPSNHWDSLILHWIFSHKLPKVYLTVGDLTHYQIGRQQLCMPVRRR